MNEGTANEFEELRKLIQKFAVERDWDKFHTPKNLAVSLCVMPGEAQLHGSRPFVRHNMGQF